MLISQLLEPEPPHAGVVGIEREYRVLDRTAEPIDFRKLIGTLGLPGGGLDPADPNAHHLPSGLLLTADGPEAEIATPPIPLTGGSTRVASAWIEDGETALVAALPLGFGIEGYSTHLNVAASGDVLAIATLFARRFSVGMMLMLDRSESPGLLVRPRPGRLELGGDFADGEQLRAALTYASGAARACANAVTSDSTLGLPPAPRGRIVAAKDRPGWFVDRTAFAPDLYERGRDAQVRCGREPLRAGDHLAASWRVAREALAGQADADELAIVDDIVAARSPIPLEALSPPDGCESGATEDSPFSNLHPRDRGGVRVEAVAMSWAAVAFRVQAPSIETHLVVPRRWLRSFLDRLDEGALDDVLLTAEASDRGPRIIRNEFDRRSVVPPEPVVRASLWRDRRPEIAGLVAGGAIAFSASQWWPW